MTKSLGELLVRMREGVASAGLETDSTCAVIARRQHEVALLIDELHRKATLRVEQHQVAVLDELRPRVVAACNRGDFAGLSPREARAGARMFGALEPRVLDALLRARPEAARACGEEFFRSWDALDPLPNRATYAQIVSHIDLGLPATRILPMAQLVTSIGPERIAAAAPRTNIGDAMQWLKSQGLPLRWDFTAHVSSLIVSWRMTTNGFDDVWRALEADAELAASLLPPRANPKGQWFFPGSSGRWRGSTRARALVVASLLYHLRGEQRVPADSFVDGLLNSDFGDPRIPPESRGWQLVRTQAPEEYSKFLENLIREDLTLFFNHAMSDAARRQFWLTYIKSIRRTVAVLSRPTYESLKQQLQGAKPELRAALGRVRRYSPANNVNAFCLYFDRFVIVEFSQTGNAAYIYRRDDFDRRIEPRLANGTIRNENDLKQTDLRYDKINHHVGWTSKAHAWLRREGIGH